jgi:hypothetical protein
LTALPILSATIVIDDHLFHEVMLWLVLPASIIALTMGCRKHRNFKIMVTGAIGLSIIVFVTFWGHHVLGETWEKWVSSLGGIVLAYAHYLNYKACQAISCSDDKCASDHHH